MQPMSVKVIALSILMLTAAFAIVDETVPIFAKPDPQRDDFPEETDNLFNNSHLQVFSGCDQQAWEDIHQAVRADLPGAKELPRYSQDEDITRMNRIFKCVQTVTEKQEQSYKELASQFIGMDARALKVMSDPSNPSAAMGLAIQVIGDRKKNSELLDNFVTLGIIKSDAELAHNAYSSQADETRYRDIVGRYNALVAMLANARLAQGYSFPVRPNELHCSSRTNSVTGEAQTDCQ